MLLLVVTLQASVCNFVKNNTPPLFFFTTGTESHNESHILGSVFIKWNNFSNSQKLSNFQIIFIFYNPYFVAE